MRVRGTRSTGLTSSAIPSSAGSSKPAHAPNFTSVSVARARHLGLGAATAPGPFEGQLLEAQVGVHALLGLYLGPASLALELPRQGVVGQVDVEDLLQAVLQLGVVDRGHGL